MMGTGRRRRNKGGGGGSQYESSDEDSLETCSVFSGESRAGNNRASQQNTDEDGSNSGAEEVDHFEDKLKEAIDGASTVKTGPRRTTYLQVLRQALADRFCPEFLATRPCTMVDIVEKSVKKGRPDEQAAACALACILVLQYGPEPDSVHIYDTLNKTLGHMVTNAGLPYATRQQCANALAITAYIADTNPLNIREIMDELRSVFSGAYLKGDGMPPTITPEQSALYQTALQSWALLLTALPADLAYNHLNRHLAPICGVLESNDVDLCIAAGETIALMFEIGRGQKHMFKPEDPRFHLQNLRAKLNELKTGSQKSHTKKDRKIQKSSFRDIERGITDEEGPDFTVHFGVEALHIRTWVDKRTYDALIGVLGRGMNHHLQTNDCLRSLFSLGAPLVPGSKESEGLFDKASKFKRHMANVAMDRHRTQKLAKHRDKRMDVCRSD
ncbi:interferon-related developmental regulator 1-like isoform X1 [Varroa jacobsoni]|uniref:interferon-related developmental regulator 1-like isoform X1 n=1 Tax=Varroa jacobsoni TaxID=62625 RepID=UPI000BF36C7E|nr:interferon-related developmental regulator 1-like isoform X1 [Varroa jacobsoni]